MRSDNLPTVMESTPVKEAIVAISEGRLGTVLVLDESGKLVALASDGDIRRALMSDSFSLDAPVCEYATYSPQVITDENMLASDALVMIEEKKIQLLAVTDESGSVKGVLHLHALVEAGIS